MKNLVLAAVLATCGAANAGVAVCALGDGTRDTGWSVVLNDAQVTVCQFVGNAGTGRNKGTLNLTVLVKTKEPIQMEFKQVNKAAINSFGLRMTMNIRVNNQLATIKELRGRTDELFGGIDEDENQFVEDAHPGKAHFHQDTPFNPGPFTASLTCDCESDRQFRLSGLLGSSTVGLITGIGLHQIEQKGVRRNFTLTLEPRFQ
ncbi:MAG: hypothetical protein ACREXG_11580 [Polaromonas sp.]